PKSSGPHPTSATRDRGIEPRPCFAQPTGLAAAYRVAPGSPRSTGPDPMHLSELKVRHVSGLIEMAIGLDIENANRLRKQELMFAILKRKAKTGESIYGDGVLEVLPDGFGFLRSPETSYLASTDD